MWEERRRVDLSTSDALLHVTCWDWDKLGTDDFLGECLLDLSQYATGRTHRLVLELDKYDSKISKEEVKGCISIEVTIERPL